MTNPKKNRERGKRNEKALADRLEGKRLGILGFDDVQVEVNGIQFSIEAKSFVRYAGVKILEQAERNAPEGKIPLAIVHIKGQRRDNDLVIMRLSEWEKTIIPIITV